MIKIKNNTYLNDILYNKSNKMTMEHYLELKKYLPSLDMKYLEKNKLIKKNQDTKNMENEIDDKVKNSTIKVIEINIKLQVKHN